MARESVPVVMITTTRAPIDVKGGMLGIEDLENELYRTNLLEVADAKTNDKKYPGQAKLFGKMGISLTGREFGKQGRQLFNTNTVMTNDTVLQPFLRELREILGLEEYNRIISPKMMMKSAVQKDGKEYVQLEGPLGSSVLSLAGFLSTTDNPVVKLLCAKHNIDHKKFLRIVNIDVDRRTDFFAPIKFPIDYWLQFFSDHFRVDTTTWKLVNLRPGHVPALDTPDQDKDKYYSNVLNLFSFFGDNGVIDKDNPIMTSTIGLDYMKIRGKVKVAGSILRGRVVAINESDDLIDLTSGVAKDRLISENMVTISEDGRLIFENILIVVDANGNIKVIKLSKESDIDTEVSNLASDKSSSAGTYQGVLFDPGYIISDRDKVLHQPVTAALRTPEQVRTILQQAKEQGTPLQITAHLRGVDGPGSSLDLPEFQKALTAQGAKAVHEITSTPTLASEFSVTVSFEAAADPDVIEYIAPDYGIAKDAPYIVKGNIELTSEGKTPNKQKDAPAYIFSNMFGLSGVRIICESISPMALAGGMESSNAFNVALFAAASMLSGQNWTMADIFSKAVEIENNELSGLTGGQGHLSSMLGGAYHHIWLSGIKDDNGNLINPYGAFSVPFISPSDYPFLESHMALAQAGKEYKDGRAVSGRTAALINNMWTDLLREKDRIGVALHSEKLGLTARYIQALKDKDVQAVVEIVNRYVDIRDELCRRWAECVLNEEKQDWLYRLDAQDREVIALYGFSQRDDRIVEDFIRLNPDDGQFNTNNLNTAALIILTDIYEKRISLYTDTAKDLIAAARKQGIAVMPLGAGGPGANLVTISSKGKQHLEQFFAGMDLPELTDWHVRSIITGTGTLKGYMPFKIGKEPIQFKGFEELGLQSPALPVPAEYIESDAVFATFVDETQFRNSFEESGFIIHFNTDPLMIGVIARSIIKKYVSTSISKLIRKSSFEVNDTVMVSGNNKTDYSFELTRVSAEKIHFKMTHPKAPSIVFAKGVIETRAKSSSAGIALSHLSDYEAERILIDRLLDYEFIGTPDGLIKALNDAQGIVVYSDSLRKSQALQDRIRKSAGNSRKFFLVLSKSELMSADELLNSLNIGRNVFQKHVFTQDTLSADQLALMVASFLRANEIKQGRVFTNTEEDLIAWSRQGLVEALVMILKDRRFELISDYSQQHIDYMRTHKQALIAA
jgi:hypothetical protein